MQTEGTGDGGNGTSKPKLLELARQRRRVRRRSIRTEQAYVRWIEQFLRFQRAPHGGRCVHPTDMGNREVNEFLSHLAVDRQVAASTQNRALSALLFLYSEVLGASIEPWRRHPIHESTVQKSVRLAVRRAGITKPAGCHTLRPSFATHVSIHGTCGIQTPLDSL